MLLKNTTAILLALMMIFGVVPIYASAAPEAITENTETAYECLCKCDGTSIDQYTPEDVYVSTQEARKANSSSNSFFNLLTTLFTRLIESIRLRYDTRDAGNSGVFYEQLDDAQKKVYRYLYGKKNEAINDENISITAVLESVGWLENSEVHKAISSLCTDQPEFFYIVIKYRGYYLSGNNKIMEICFHKNDSNLQSNLNKIDSVVNEIVKESEDKSDYDKAKIAHDRICEIMTYELHQALGIDGFIVKKGQCMTYALMYKYLLNNMDIEGIYVNGSVYGSSNYGIHAWNYVKLDGKWYFVDVTFDDGNTIRYDYFMIGSNQSSKTHDPEPSPAFPELSKNNYK